MNLKPFKPLTIRKPGEITDQTNSHTSEQPAKRRKLSPTIEDANGYSSRPISKSNSKIPEKLNRGPLHEVPNPPSPTETTKFSAENGVANYYSVLWRNFTSKKNKTWAGDGVLTVHDGYATMYDSSGRCLGRTAFSGPMLPGSSLSISGKEVEVDNVITREEFLSMAKPHGNDKKQSSKPISTSAAAKPMQSNTTTNSNLSFQSQLKAAMLKSKTNDKTNSVSNSGILASRTSAFKQPLKGTTVQVQTPGLNPIPRHDPQTPGAVIFKQPNSVPNGQQVVDVVLDPLISKNLREHQKEGVKFLYECVMDLRDFGGQGCILADDMGLGKTLQTIALLWTLIKQNPVYRAPPVVKKALIVCPVSLIRNWKKEFRKWLGSDRLGVLEYEDQKTRLSMFDGKTFNVMIIGYERLRMVAEDLAKGPPIDIVICDEGHRLKTIKNKSAKAIESLNTPRRIILSGTPIQNDLGEFFAMANFVNDGCLGSQKAFQKDFEMPIMKSRQPGATEEDIERGEEAGEELARTTSPFILRRTVDVLSNFLPPKTEYVLFCKPTPEQATVYRSVIKSPMFQNALGSNETALQLISILKKLCNSPALMQPKLAKDDSSTTTSLMTLNEMLPTGTSKLFRNSASSKIRLLDELLQQIRKTTDEKVVLVSNYTSTLDLMENLLINSNLKYLRLDGTIAANKRQGLVDQFNRAKPSHLFAFLLSAKAGGLGINLIGASRLILFDVDWNPATDDQAMARIHRQGQRNHCRIYRFLLKGSLEERIWQRQVVKKGLADSIMDSGGSSMTNLGSALGKSKKGKAVFSQEELRDLFRFDDSDGLRTHDLINCPCEGSGIKPGSEKKDSDLPFYDDSADLSEQDELESLPDPANLGDVQEAEFAEKSITTPGNEDEVEIIKKDVAEKQELMQYIHLDTSKVSELQEESETFGGLEIIVNDPCLMNVLRQDEQLMAGGVSYLFKKTSGVKSKEVADAETATNLD